jgi:hypothetical protein
MSDGRDLRAGIAPSGRPYHFFPNAFFRICFRSGRVGRWVYVQRKLYRQKGTIDSWGAPKALASEELREERLKSSERQIF